MTVAATSGDAGYESMLELVLGGERFASGQFDAAVARGLDGASLLPGWSRKHVISHLEGNALALLNLVIWARTGVETPMYGSPEERAASIEAGTRRPDREVVEGARAAGDQLVEALRELPEEARTFEVRTAMGRTVPVERVSWMRIRETWIHAVDLDVGAGFNQMPGAVVDPLLDEVVTTLSAKPGCPALHVTATDIGRSWQMGGDRGPEREIAAPSAQLLGWLLGREGPEAKAQFADIALPAWL